MSARVQEVAFRRYTGAVYLCVVALLIFLHLPRIGPYESLETLLRPLRLGLRTTVRGAPPPVAVTVVRPAAGPAPSPDELAEDVRAATRGGARAVGLHVPDRLAFLPGTRLGELAAALEKSGRTVLCLSLVRGGVTRRLMEVQPELEEKAAGVAFLHPRPDNMGRASSLVLYGLTRQRGVMGSAIELMRVARGIPRFNLLHRPGRLVLEPLPGQPGEPLELPLDDHGAIPVNDRFLGAFERLERRALRAAEAGDPALRGRIVLLETPREPGEDPLLSPSGEPVTRGEVEACALASMLEGRVEARLPWALEALGILFVALVPAVIGYLRGPGPVLAAGVSLLGLWVAGALVCDLTAGVLVPLVRPGVLLALVAGAGLLRHRYRPVIGVQVRTSSSGSPREARAALQLGIKLLQKGDVDESIKYFQKVARIESELRTRSQYFLSLVLLRRGDTQAASTLISALDFASLPRAEAYTLAKELETRGDLDTAHTLYEKLARDASDFRDVAERLEALKDRLSKVSEEEIVEMMVRKVLDRRFGDIERVGRGGMGFVYRGCDAQCGGGEVALKILSPFFANHDKIRTRFLREAELAAKLAHPNIVRIHEVFDKSLPYYSMEFIGALSVKEVLAGVGRFPVRDALELALQVCDGLEVAHEHGVVHRDVKPDNLMINDECVVKIIDFGIAKDLAGEELTGTRKRMGTPEYMSPEQVMAEPLDHRSDIYSFGIVLYEMLTGDVPFEEIRDHLTAPVPPPSLEIDLPPRLVQVLNRMLAKDPADRQPSMASLREEFRALLVALGPDDEGAGGGDPREDGADGDDAHGDGPGGDGAHGARGGVSV